MNAQISKFFRKWSIYAGCENIGDFTQKNPIIAADDPWGSHFDSSKIWGPCMEGNFISESGSVWIGNSCKKRGESVFCADKYLLNLLTLK